MKKHSITYFFSALFVFVLYACNHLEKENSKIIFTNTISPEHSAHEPASISINGDIENGKKLFKANCSACHTLNDKKMVAPGMKDVFLRVPQPAEQWIINYIKNNSSVKKAGDEYALQLQKQYDSSPMPAFENVLTDTEINDIVYFLYYDKISD